MKKILLSLAVIAVVGAVAVSATGAFFSDTETSTGNTFTAGAIDLQVKSQCSYNGGASTQCGSWDYPTGQESLTLGKFFNFTDLKPGDWGENTISFKVINNDAWMCGNITSTNNDNGINEPEALAGDTTDGASYGELGNYLNVFWWVDTNGNNIYETGEKVLYGGPRTLNAWLALGGGSLPLTFADSYLNWTTWPAAQPNTLPIPGVTEQHLGVGWCFGTMTVTGTGNPGFSCSGAGSQNDSQTDSVTADLTFTAEQHRNNPNFLCPEHRLQ